MTSEHTQGVLTLLGAALLLAPCMEKERWRELALHLDQGLGCLLEPIDTDAILAQRAFPHFQKLVLAREKLLMNPKSARVAIENEDRAVRQRISEILYPVVIDQNAALSIWIDMDTGRLEVRPRGVRR